VNTVESRLPAVAVLLLGLLAAAPASASVIGLVRDRLHYLCGYYTMGGATGEFSCQDGISYIASGAGLFAGLVLVVALASLGFTRAAAWAPVRAVPRRWLALVSVLPVVVFLLAVNRAAAPTGAPDRGPEEEYWSSALTTMVVLLVAAAVLALAAAASASWRLALACSVGSSVTLMGVVVVEQGAAAPAIVSVTMLAASLLVPTPHPPADG
jgi:hypothetical protein